jgi:Fur family iron response transcriptional regulator
MNMLHKKSCHAQQNRLLEKAGFRQTRQRKTLASILFDGTHKHMTAEQVHAAARKKRAALSLATVYNTLHQFTEAGLLRQIVLDCSSVYFDTNVESHHHFFNQKDGKLADIPSSAVDIARLPKPPAGTKLDGVDVILRVSPKH